MGICFGCVVTMRQGAVRDLRDAAFQPGVVRKVGVADAAAVRLSMADNVPADVRTLIESTAAAIASGRVIVPEAYDGPEFQTPV